MKVLEIPSVKGFLTLIIAEEQGPSSAVICNFIISSVSRCVPSFCRVRSSCLCLGKKKKMYTNTVI